ncbi:MAG: DEAD/DEAH box helicase [Actinobacteria bacterium]|nr:MAG: DEAD/DEAH box helicase [Actinomycetota bacterium]
MRNSRRSFSNSKNRYRGDHRPTGRGGRHNQATFDPSLLVKQAEPNQAKQEYCATHQFADFAICDQLKRNIGTKGYKFPTPIQDQSIPHILEGKDVVGIANTGTGKTAAFLIPLIEKVVNYQGSRVLIITPTRELALQVRDELTLFSKGLRVHSALCIGGASINVQIDHLRKKPQFVIGTPGRLNDLKERGKLYYPDFKSIVLDEVDRMLDMGFIHEIKYIINNLPKERHSLFFSATITDSVRGIMEGFLSDPVFVTVESSKPAANVDQDIIKTNGRAKVEVLHELLITEGFDKVLVFGRTKWGMEKLAKDLNKRGFNVASIHGNKSQAQRQQALKQFRNSHVQALLATDVASRGLDIDDVTHVINYDLPQSYEDYVHRIGRTGRADKTGLALTFVE